MFHTALCNKSYKPLIQCSTCLSCTVRPRNINSTVRKQRLPAQCIMYLFQATSLCRILAVAEIWKLAETIDIVYIVRWRNECARLKVSKHHWMSANRKHSGHEREQQATSCLMHCRDFGQLTTLWGPPGTPHGWGIRRRAIQMHTSPGPHE